jgi:hypothetical protein
MSPFSSLVSLASALVLAALSMPSLGQTPSTQSSISYADAAREVTADIQKRFYLSERGLYAHSVKDRSPDFMWGNGVTFSALVAAARHDPKTYGPIMARFFTSMNRYWDTKVKIPGYEPVPTRGNGNDKYYDDNQWMVITFVEAFELTGEERYRARAVETNRFSLSGWDDQLGGGIWWHEGHKDGSKNTCSNAPAAVACLVLAKTQTGDEAKENVEWARRIVEWTVKHLEADDGLFGDAIKVDSGHVNKGRLTYNTALMLRAYIGLYRATGEQAWLDKAKRVAKNSDWFLSDKTGAYRDELKWSHLMVEADLEMYRLTNESYLYDRARRNADYMYAKWKDEPPEELINLSSIARTLWLMADMETEVGQKFWERVDRGGK